MTHILISSENTNSSLKNKVKRELAEEHDILDCGESYEKIAMSIDKYVHLFGIVLATSSQCNKICMELNKSFNNVRAGIAWDINSFSIRDTPNVVCLPIDYLNGSQLPLVLNKITKHFEYINASGLPAELIQKNGLIEVF